MIKTSTVQLSDLRKQESAAHSRSRVEAGEHSRDRAAAGAHSEAGLRLVHTAGGRAAAGTHSEAERWFVCQIVHFSHCRNIRVITMTGYSYRGFTS